MIVGPRPLAGGDPAEFPGLVGRLVDELALRGGRPVIVGGAVRDALLGIASKDIDIEVFGLAAEEFESAIRSTGLPVHAVGRSFGVLKVSGEEGVVVDLSLPRRESKRGAGHRGFLVTPDPAMSFADAAARRDFTINAIGWDPRRGELLDPWSGVEDLRGRCLRHVGPAFVEDPLRVLRGMQFCGRYRLVAVQETLELCRELLPEAQTLAGERVWEEWRKWAERAVAPAAGLSFLRGCGWHREFPGLGRLEGCPQDPRWHPEGDVWEHTLLVCDAAAGIALREQLVAEDRGVLLLAALIHDLGKPATTAIDRDGRIRSRGHNEEVGTFTAFLDAVGAPASIARRVVILARRHLDHLGYRGSRRAVRRLARTLGEEGETLAGLIRLIEADHSGRPPLSGGLPDQAAAMLAVARELAALDSAPKPLLRGRDLLSLGVGPGPRLGRLLEGAYEAQLDGAFSEREQALEWVRDYLEGEEPD